MTGAIIAFGLRLVRIVWRVDLKSTTQGIQGVELDTGVRLLENTWRAVAGAVAYIAFWVIVFIPWQVFGNVFRASNPNLSRAVIDVGSAVIVFVAAGFCLHLLRMGIAVTLAVRDIANAPSPASAGMNPERDSSTTSPSGLMRVALFVTTPTDFDLLFQAAIAVWAMVGLVNYAHSQHYPL